MTKEKWYRLVYDVLRPIGALLYPQKFYGLENIPEGPAILCAPHSNVADPILISFALGRKTYVHHLAKAESKTMFIFGWLMKKAGSIFVKRGERDIDSFKQCMRVLKAGEKLIVFPEGTRVREGDVSHPHVGAVTFACRTDAPMTEEIRRKIGLFCNVEPECVIQNLTASTLYEVPLLLEREGLCRVVCRKLGLGAGEPDMRHWQDLVTQIHAAEQHHVTIALVGKYTELHDAYLSVAESLFHAGTACGAQVDIRWVDSQHLTAENLTETLCGCSGILVPGGFGDRGIEGMILAAQYAREKGIPYLGICLGMQIAVIEFARHAAGWADAHSAEFSAVTAHPVIDLMPDQVGVTAKGGTMRLGKYPCVLAEGTKAREAYGQREIWERHRHRYECSNVFRPELEAVGLRVAGTSPDGRLVEMVEIPDHPWFVGCQFHPEFKSRPDRPHPLFRGFVAAALAQQ